jgi:hypothetical protein
MRRSLNSLRATWIVALTCLLSGCGGDGANVPYEGVVTLNGKPLADANVALLPLTATGAGPFTGTTGSDGKFSLGLAGGADRSGVAPGEYRLTISTLKVAPMEGGDDSAKPQVLAPELVPEEYRTGNMRVDVPAEGTTTATFDIIGHP